VVGEHRVSKKQLKEEIKRLRTELRRTRKAFHSLALKVGFAAWSIATADIPEEE
jgi:hypothetical protein